MKFIREVEGPSIRDLIASMLFSRQQALWLSNENPILTGSGKAAIALVLNYLKKTNVIRAKTDKVLMAQWLGYWVYNQVNEFARPVFSTIEKDIKVIIPYHQYGFPQDMVSIQQFAESIGAVVIEDCAHALYMRSISEQNNFTANNLRIYSISKYIFCFALGAVVGGDKSFTEYANIQIINSSTYVTKFNNFVKYLNEMYLSGKLIDLALWNNLLAMSYALYGKGFKPSDGAIRLMNLHIDDEISSRLKRYSIYRERFAHLDIECYLGRTDVAPYVIPLKLSVDKMQLIMTSLQLAGFQTGIYRFDVNRNMLDPKFEKVLWVLVHSGISDSLFQKQLEIIEKLV